MPGKTRRAYRFFALILLLTGLGGALFFTSVLAYAPIDFEGLNTNGVPGKIVTTDYANRGISFTPVWAVDFSSIAPDFAHSGVMALAPCVGIWAENCSAPLEISFCHDQQEVGLWVGYTGQLSTAMTVVMRAFDINGVERRSVEITLGPSAGPIPVRKYLLAQTSVPKIRRVTVGFKRPDNPNEPIPSNLGLVIDDVWFDDQTPCSVVCPVGQAPAFSINLPINGQNFIQNTLTVGGDLPAANPGAMFRIDVTGPQGQTHRHGPHSISPGPIFLPNLGGLLFPGTNSLVFTVNDCAGSYSVLRTVNFYAGVTKTRFLVIDDRGFSVGGAEIYADGNLKGRTDTSGKLTVEPAIPVGTKVIARKMVYESSTDREYHKEGSYQNWKGRWYISNLAVNNDGSLSPDEVTVPSDPLGYQVIRVRKRNTLVGLNLIVSLEWDATVAELEAVKQEVIDTSYRLYNATDGQVMIEQAKIADEATYWVTDTDIRILGNVSARAKTKRNSFFNTSTFWPSRWNKPYVRLARNERASVIVHELGHYLFGVRDEYEIAGGGSSYCTAKLVANEPPYDRNSQYASCVMDEDWGVTSKFCSTVATNPHNPITEQGTYSCWTRILDRFSDDDDRWLLQSPETRGVIVGEINHGSLPMVGWMPRVTIENRGKPFLCAPTVLHFAATDGSPMKDHEIKLTDLFGTWSIVEGNTDDNGNILVAGMHLGDRVGGRQVSSCTLAAMSTPQPANNRLQSLLTNHSGSQPDPRGLAQQVMVAEPPRFHIFTELKPFNRNEAEIFVRAQTISGEPLTIDQAPVVRVSSTGSRDVLNVSMNYKASRAGFVGILHKLPGDGSVQIAVTATNRSGEGETTTESFQIGENDPDDTEITSANGQLSFRFPPNALPRGTTTSIGPGTITNPVLPSGFEVVNGPYAIWWSTDNCFPGFGALKFELSRGPDRSAMAGYIRDSFRILYYDADMRRWVDIGGTVFPPPFDIVSELTSRMGNYVLVARRNPGKMNARQRKF